MTAEADWSRFGGLTARERDILQLLAQDLTDREIANRLFVAHSTVRWYNRQIYSKLGVENRHQAVEHAFALGMIKPANPQDAPKHNLPASITPFIGRKQELEELKQRLIDNQTRLITILGPGGMGKTRLALALAETLFSFFPDGLYYAPLASASTFEQVVRALANSVGFQFVPDSRSSIQQLSDFLRQKQVLLLLDNFEHLLDQVSLIDTLLKAAAGLKVLITSRERLNLNGETVFMLKGMDYPNNSQDNAQREFGAMQLFIASAQRVQPKLMSENQSEIVRICQLVEGMPLAIEIAAAWTRTLTAAEVICEIEHSADFIRSPERNVPERLQSVRAVFESTWRQLSAKEQHIFRGLSIFRGGFTRAAGQAITGADADVLALLVDKALVWYSIDTGRYRIHELLRQYAEGELESAGAASQIKDAYSDYFATLSRKWGMALKTPQQIEALKLLETEMENIHQAFRMAINNGNPEIIERFIDHWFYYEVRGQWLEGETFMSAACARLAGQDSRALGKALAARALYAARISTLEQSYQFASESTDMLRRCNALEEIPYPMLYMGMAVQVMQGAEAAVPLFREAIVIAEQYGDQWATAAPLFFLARIAKSMGHMDEARSIMYRTYQLATALGNAWGLPYILAERAALSAEMGDLGDARQLHYEQLTLSEKIGSPYTIVAAHLGLAEIAWMHRDAEQAKHHLESCLKLARDKAMKDFTILSMIGIAEATIALGQFQEARLHLSTALQEYDGENVWQQIHLLLTVAEFLMNNGGISRAVEIVGIVSQRPEIRKLDSRLATKLNQLTQLLQHDLVPEVCTSDWQGGKRVNDMMGALLTELTQLQNSSNNYSITTA